MFKPAYFIAYILDGELETVEMVDPAHAEDVLSDLTADPSVEVVDCWRMTRWDMPTYWHGHNGSKFRAMMREATTLNQNQRCFCVE